MPRTFILKVTLSDSHAFVGPDSGEPDVFGGTRTYEVVACEDAIHSVTVRVPGMKPVVTNQPGHMVTVDNTVFFIGQSWRNQYAHTRAVEKLLILLHKELPQPEIAL